MQTKADDIALNILGNIIRALGPGWDRRLNDAARTLVRSCCTDAARLSVRALATPRNRDLQLELFREKARIHARLDGLGAQDSDGRIAEVFWEGFAATVNGASAFAFAAL